FADNVTAFLNKGDGSGALRPAPSASVPYGAGSVAVGDFNGDGAADLAVAEYFGTAVAILSATRAIGLAADPAGSGVRSGYARGNLSGNGTDLDYFSFTALPGDVATLAAENLAGAPGTSLLYTLFDAAGTALATDYAYNAAGGYNGAGQASPV